MSYAKLLEKTLELVAAAQAAGALAAELRLQQHGVTGDPRLRQALQGVVDALGVGPLEEISTPQLDTAVAQLTYALQEGLDLIAAPEREPGWTYQDDGILQERGRGSRHMAHRIASLVRERPAFAPLLSGASRLLDVGTGAGWIAIEATKIWPQMSVVGIDVLQPALDLAARNVVAEGVADRVTLRQQSVTDLDEEATYAVAWVPTMFLTQELLARSLPRLARALVPGGMLVLGMFSPAPVAYGGAVRDLLTVRSGGHPWRPEDLSRSLPSAGFADAEHVTFGASTEVIVARRP